MSSPWDQIRSSIPGMAGPRYCEPKCGASGDNGHASDVASQQRNERARAVSAVSMDIYADLPNLPSNVQSNAVYSNGLRFLFLVERCKKSLPVFVRDSKAGVLEVYQNATPPTIHSAYLDLKLDLQWVSHELLSGNLQSHFSFDGKFEGLYRTSEIVA